MSADAQAVLDWLRADIARGGGTGRRPSKIEMGLGWFGDDDDPDRLGRAVRELLELGLVYLHRIPGIGMGPWVCVR